MEVYDNQFIRDLSSNYTAGSGTLSVSAAAPSSVLGGTFRVRLMNSQNTLLKVTGGQNTTTWTVVAEANDANCAAGPKVVLGCEITAGGMAAILLQAGGNGIGTYAGLPSTSGLSAGYTYRCTDSPITAVFDGASWQYFIDGLNILAPINPSDWVATNSGTGTVSQKADGTLSGMSVSSGSVQWDHSAALPSPPFTIFFRTKFFFTTDNYSAVTLALWDSTGIGSGSSKCVNWKLMMNSGLSSGTEIVALQYFNVGGGFNSDQGRVNYHGSIGEAAVKYTNDGVNAKYYLGHSWSKLNHMAPCLSKTWNDFITPTYFTLAFNPSSSTPANALIYDVRIYNSIQ
jgi:hypothetical protein